MIPVPKVTDVERAFPVSKSLGELPTEVPATYELKEKWKVFFGDLWLSNVMPVGRVLQDQVGMIPREGVVAADAWNALGVLMGSRDLKHENKERMWCYLGSQWFSDVRWERSDGFVQCFEDAEFDTEWVKSR